MINKFDNQEYSVIERFFEGELNETELEAFEKKLYNNQDFAKSVELYEYAYQTSVKLYVPETNDHAATKQRWQTLHDHYQTDAKTVSLFPFQKLWKVAAVVLFTSVAAWFVLKNQPTTMNQGDARVLAQEMAQSTVNLDAAKSQLRSTNTNEIANKDEEIVDAYEQNKYEQVVTLTNDKNTNLDAVENQHVILLRALALKKLGKNDKALQLFESMVVAKNGQIDVALWNIVAICLSKQTANTAKAKTALERIIEEKFPTKDEAQQILKSLQL